MSENQKTIEDIKLNGKDHKMIDEFCYTLTNFDHEGNKLDTPAPIRIDIVIKDIFNRISDLLTENDQKLKEIKKTEIKVEHYKQIITRIREQL